MIPKSLLALDAGGYRFRNTGADASSDQRSGRVGLNIGLRWQKPPLPWIAARHCSNVTKPQFE